MTFYRKYRPQTLEELVGQTSVKQTLKSAILASKLAHAYLFTGPRGSGKTSTARILAKIVNCEKFKDLSKADLNSDLPVPCNVCESCITITNGTNMDVIEMDAASNRGIEDIRALRENIKLASSGANKKIYIIDEVHMLTGEAFNALLKTLEEPPSHVMFILATTDPQKIPQTILSRVQRLDFNLASTQDLVENLKYIAGKEKLKVSDEAILSLAKKAQGSFRDGSKLLDQVSSYDDITEELIEKLFASSTKDEQFKLIGFITAKNSNQALQTLLELENSGTNLKELNLNLQDILRQILLIKNDLGEAIVSKDVKEEDYKILVDLSQKFVMGDLLKTIDYFQTSIENSKFSLIPSLPLEVAVLQSCLGTIMQTSSVEQVEVKKIIPKAAESLETTTLRDDIIEEVEPVSAESIEDIKKLTDKWQYVLETVKDFNFSLEALLRSAKILSIEGNAVILEVPYTFHQRILEAAKSRDPLESILSDILGRSIKISTVLGKRKLKAEELANLEVAQDDEIVRLASEIFSSDGLN